MSEVEQLTFEFAQRPTSKDSRNSVGRASGLINLRSITRHNCVKRTVKNKTVG